MNLFDFCIESRKGQQVETEWLHRATREQLERAKKRMVAKGYTVNVIASIKVK